MFFFSLDVEGAEWEIIQHIPWPKVDIRLLLIENVHLGENNARLEQFLSHQGYEIKQKIGEQDIVFMKKNTFNLQYSGDLKT